MPPNRGPVKKTQYVKTRGGKVVNKKPRTGPTGPKGNTGPTGPKGNTSPTGQKQRTALGRAVGHRITAKEQREVRKVRKAERTTKPLTNAQRVKMGGDAVHSPKGRPFRLIDPLTKAGRTRIAVGSRTQRSDVRGMVKEADKTLDRKGSRQLAKRETAIDTLRSLGGLVDKPSKVQKAGERQTARYEKQVKKQLDKAAMGETPVGETAWRGGKKGPAKPNLKTVGDIASGKATAELVEGAKKGVEKVSGATMKAVKAVDKAVSPKDKKGKQKISTAGFVTGLGLDPKSVDIAGKVGENALKDFIDLPANAIPSVYLPAREAVKGKPGKAAKMLTKPYVDLAKNPGKMAIEHPVVSALLVSGAYGGVGRGAGKAARVTTGGRVGSIKGRTPKTVEGTSLSSPRYYSKNIITKQVQKTLDRGEPKPRMSSKEVQRRVDFAMARNEGVRRVNRSGVVKKIDDAVKGKKGRPRIVRTRRFVKVTRRPKEPTAATQLATQNIITGKDHALLGELKHYRTQVASAVAETERKMAADAKTARDLRPIHNTQKSTLAALDQAITRFDPAEVTRAADAYAKLSVELQNNLVEQGLVSKDQAAMARLIPYAVQKMGAKHDGERIVSATGQPISIEQVRAHMARNGVKEPAFITQAPNQRGARNYYVAQTGGVVVRSPKRTGRATATGSFDVSPETMIESAVRAQGLVDAATGWTRVLQEFGRRDNGKLAPHKTYREAKAEATKLAEEGNGSWVPVKVAPFGVKKEQLDKVFSEESPASRQRLQHDLQDATVEGQGVTPKDTSGQWVLMPKEAAQRINEHVKMIGRGGLDPLGTVYGSLFRGVVLSTSPKWLAGNVVEGGLRSVIAHAGPRSWWTGRKWRAAVERLDPEYVKLLDQEVLGGGMAGMSMRVNKHVTASSFAEGSALQKMAQIGGTVGRAPVTQLVPKAWNLYTHFVFTVVNRGIERQFQTAMAGKAIRDQLMPENLMMLSNKAIEQAAKDSLDLNTLVSLGKAVDEMYGRYSKFGPKERFWISTYTPFIRWAVNAAQFVIVTLPKDHPVATAVAASAFAASEDWRKDKGLSMFLDQDNGGVPSFLQGSIPGAGGSNLRISRYTPFGAYASKSGVVGTLAGGLLPQYMSIYAALHEGRDWKGKEIRGGALANYAEAGKQLLGGFIPFFSPVTNVIDYEGGTNAKSLRKQFDPFMYTQPRDRKNKKGITWGTSAGGGVNWGGSSSGSGGVNWGGK